MRNPSEIPRSELITERRLTTRECAEVLRVKSKTVRVYIKDGLISAETIGRKYLIRRSELLRFMRANRKG